MKQKLLNREGQPVRASAPAVSMTARQMEDIRIEDIRIVLHRTHVANGDVDFIEDHGGVHEGVRDDGLYGGNDLPRWVPARFIAEMNHSDGWVNTPLTGDYQEDYDAATDDREIYRRLSSVSAKLHLDRPQLEIAVLADQLMRECSQPLTGVEKAAEERQRAAIAEAQALLANDSDGTLDRIAAPLFRGTPEQRRRQLDQMLDGPTPGTVVCSHCYHPIDATDPHLTEERRREEAMLRGMSAETARRFVTARSALYSAHADCHAAQGPKTRGIW